MSLAKIASLSCALQCHGVQRVHLGLAKEQPKSAWEDQGMQHNSFLPPNKYLLDLANSERRRQNLGQAKH